MTSRRTLRARAAVLALVGALLAGCSGSDSTPSAEESSPSATPTSTGSVAPWALPAAPEVGSCHALEVAEAAAPTDEQDAAPCRGPHTTQTIAVGRLPQVQDGHLLAVDSATVRARLADACTPALARYVGGSQTALRLSRLQAVAFSPTLEQSDAGADWYRCDVLALRSEGRLLPLAPRMRGVLARPGALDRYGTCGTGAPGSRGFQRLACAAGGSWRAVDDVPLDTRRYLDKGAQGRADAQCRTLAEQRAAGALRFSWSFEWPTRAQWQAGQRWGLCWLPRG